MLSEYYQAATRAAALADKDWFGIVKLTGTERVPWLQGMLTNDVEKLPSGSGCYAAHLTPQGKIVAHMQVLVDDDAVWLCLEGAVVPKLLAAFDKLLIMEDVQMFDVSEEYSILAIIGPKAAAALESWIDEPLTIAGKYAHRKIDDSRIVVSDLGYDVWVPRGRADKVLRFLAQSGATPIDHGTWDVLRTEAGIPVYGVDIDETTMMPEIGEAGISYEKGCYIGQEVVARIKYIGHVNRKFVGFVCDSGFLPENQSRVRWNDKDMGYVTTALMSPALGKPVALGFVNRAAASPGASVMLMGRERSVPATVTGLPFVERIMNRDS